MGDMTPAEVLRAARALIADPARWCQYVLAQNAHNQSVAPLDPDATRWCAVGALCRVLDYAGLHLWSEIEAWLREANDARLAIAVVNDSGSPERAHANVLATFDRAIARLEALRFEPKGDGNG